jgi:hypothetical protein
MADGWDDEALLAALRQALRARLAVRSGFIEAGKGAFAWHNIDAELAQLTYDSERDPDPAASMRAEAASVRALTFTSAHLAITLEVIGDSLLGQVIPAQPASIESQTLTGAEPAFSTDGIGYFSIRPLPAARFRLCCRTAAGIEVLTGWITL